MTLDIMSNDTLTTQSFSPTITGYHQVNYWVTSDSFPSTDTIGRGTVVTDTVYGVDFDWDYDGQMRRRILFRKKLWRTSFR